LTIFINYYSRPTQYKEYLNDLSEVLNVDLEAYSLFIGVYGASSIHVDSNNVFFCLVCNIASVIPIIDNY
jgi:hypothetical protein